MNIIGPVDNDGGANIGLDFIGCTPVGFILSHSQSLLSLFLQHIMPPLQSLERNVPNIVFYILNFMLPWLSRSCSNSSDSAFICYLFLNGTQSHHHGFE